jgi:hypothetical protein
MSRFDRFRGLLMTDCEFEVVQRDNLDWGSVAVS